MRISIAFSPEKEKWLNEQIPAFNARRVEVGGRPVFVEGVNKSSGAARTELKNGDVVEVVMQPEDAFGEHEPELIRIEPVDAFPVEVEVGMMFETDMPDGDVVVFRVTDVADGKAVVDGNHPLAGMKIRFKATVDSVRDATAEEIEHGHVHGPHGHHH